MEQSQIPFQSSLLRLIEGPTTIFWSFHFEAGQDLPVLDYLSPQAEEIYGYPYEILSTDPSFWLRIIDPNDIQRMLELGQDLPG